MLGIAFAVITVFFIWQMLRSLYSAPAAPTLRRDMRTMTDDNDWRWFDSPDATRP